VIPILTFNSVSIIAAASRAMVGNVEHMVIPVIGIREGVLNDVFYPHAELSAAALAWNGVPIPVSHPKDASGAFVTANSLEADASQNIGKFLNVHFEAKTKALKGEMWINIQKATDLGHKSLLDRLDKAEQIDVSTGLWTNSDGIPGNYQGRNYSGSATHIIPDHLAILPNERGACSTDQGCGTFILNEEKEKPCCGTCADKEHKEHKEPVGMFGNFFKRISTTLGFNANEVSHNELHTKLRNQLRVQSTDRYQYIVDVFPKFFVYEQDDLLFKQLYTLGKDESVEISGEPEQVIIKKHYESISPKISTNANANTNKTMKQTHIVALAALFAANTITEAQHTSMQGLPDDVLDGLLKTHAAPPVVTTPVVAEVTPIMANEDVQLLAELRKEREERTTLLRAHVKLHCKQIPDAVVDTMTINQLQATAQGIPAAANITDYSLSGGAPVLAANNQEATKYVAPSILLAPVTAQA